MGGFFITSGIMLLFYGISHYYVGKRLYNLLRLIFARIGPKAFAAGYILFALSPLLGFGALGSIREISLYFMGLYAYLLVLFIAADLLLLLGKLIKIIPSPPPRNIRLFSGLGVILLTTGLALYGTYHATQVRHVDYHIQIQENKLPEDMKIVFISDLHLGARNTEKRLANIVAEINSLEPSVVCIAGDIFDGAYQAIRDPSGAAALLRGITAAHGVFASLGNHDYGRDLGQKLDFLEESNIQLLRDEYVVIGGRVALIGRNDLRPIGYAGDMGRKDLADILAPLGDNLVIIAMDHNPSAVEEYEGKIDLLLSGHTHKGQIFPGSLITKAIFTVHHGYYQKVPGSRTHAIVTSGVSTWGPPMRIGTDNEIVCITFG